MSNVYEENVLVHQRIADSPLAKAIRESTANTLQMKELVGAPSFKAEISSKEIFEFVQEQTENENL